MTTTRRPSTEISVRGALAREAGRRRRLEEQLEVGVVPEAALLAESQRGERGVHLRPVRQRQVHVVGRVPARGVELQRAATHQDRFDVVLGQPCGEQPEREQAPPARVGFVAQAIRVLAAASHWWGL